MTLYISDLDGTLLNERAELSTFTRATLTSLIGEGLSFTIATARTCATAGKILDGIALPLPAIMMNGVLLYDIASQKHIKVLTIGSDVMPKITAILKEHGATGFLYELYDNRLVTYYEDISRKPLRDFHDRRVQIYNKAFEHVSSFADIPPENIAYITLLDYHKNLLPVYNALAQLPGISAVLYRDIYSKDMWFLEIYSGKASKKNAALFLKDTFKAERIVGFGDNLNDLPLFEAGDEGYAVENACDELKAVATGIISANTEDGVARWLEENRNK